MEGNGEEVNDFLMRIRELGDKRDKEDAERTRKLEAEILAGREARRARRDGILLLDAEPLLEVLRNRVTDDVSNV
jgi:hypothetical protein